MPALDAHLTLIFMLWLSLIIPAATLIKACEPTRKLRSRITKPEKEQLALLVHCGIDYGRLNALLFELSKKYGCISRDLGDSIEGVPFAQDKIKKLSSSNAPIQKSRSLPTLLDEELETLESTSSTEDTGAPSPLTSTGNLKRRNSPIRTLTKKPTETRSPRRTSSASSGSEKLTSSGRRKAFSKSNPEKNNDDEMELEVNRPSRSKSGGSTLKSSSKIAITSKGCEISLHPRPERSLSLFKSLASFSPSTKRMKDKSDDYEEEPSDTLMIRALQYGLLEHVMVLFVHNAELHEQSIHTICKSPSALDAVEKIKLLFSIGGVPFVNSHDDEGKTPLHHLLRNSFKHQTVVMELLRHLINNAANADMPDDYGVTPLQYFLQKIFWHQANRLEMLKMLLETADPFQVLPNGRTLMDAVVRKHFDPNQTYQARRLILAAQKAREIRSRCFQYPNYPFQLTDFAKKLSSL